MKACSVNYKIIGEFGSSYMLREVTTGAISAVAKSVVDNPLYSFETILRVYAACGMDTKSPEAIEALRAVLDSFT